jgi:arsenate reductase (thioredoxin)
MDTATKIKVLFMCTGNSCRSQMAEAFARLLRGNLIEPYSAGTAPKGMDLRAVKVMAEVGIDISRYKSKSVFDLPDIAFDYVITLCDDAQQECPFFPVKAALIHHSFDDPPRLSEGARDEEEALHHYRRVRDEIRAYVETLPESLSQQAREQTLSGSDR